MNEYEKEIFQWFEDAGLNPVHHNMAVPHLEVSTVYSLQSVFRSPSYSRAVLTLEQMTKRRLH